MSTLNQNTRLVLLGLVRWAGPAKIEYFLRSGLHDRRNCFILPLEVPAEIERRFNIYVYTNESVHPTKRSEAKRKSRKFSTIHCEWYDKVKPPQGPICRELIGGTIVWVDPKMQNQLEYNYFNAVKYTLSAKWLRCDDDNPLDVSLFYDKWSIKITISAEIAQVQKVTAQDISEIKEIPMPHRFESNKVEVMTMRNCPVFYMSDKDTSIPVFEPGREDINVYWKRLESMLLECDTVEVGQVPAYDHGIFESYQYVSSKEEPLIIDGELLVIKERKEGPSKPSFLRNWLIEEIPDLCLFGKVKFKDHLLKRVVMEANEYGYKLQNIAIALFDQNSYFFRYYSSLCKKYDMEYFSLLGPRGTRLKLGERGPLLKHKMLCVVINAYVVVNTVPMDQELYDVVCEVFRFIIVDPIYNTVRLKDMLNFLLNLTFTQCENERVLHWGKLAPDKDQRLEKGEMMKRWTKSISVIPDDIVDDLKALTDAGLLKLSSLMKALMSAPISERNCRANALVRNLLSLSGFVGSHFPTAAFNQLTCFNGVDYAGDEFLSILSEVAADYARAIPVPQRVKDFDLRPRLLLQARNPNSASIDDAPVTSIMVEKMKYRFKEGALEISTKKERERIKLNDKSSAILSLSREHFINCEDILSVPRPIGFRVITGARPTRVIFPMSLLRYACEIMSSVHIQDALSRFVPSSSMDMFAVPGGGAEFGVPHQTLAHVLKASSQLDNRLVVLAVDYSQFDSSQRANVRAAFKRGILMGMYQNLGMYPVKDDTSENVLDWSIPKMFDYIYTDRSKGGTAFKVDTSTMVHTGLPSGTLMTYCQNTIVNAALSEYLRMTIQKSVDLQKYVPKFEHIMGDDKITILSSSIDYSKADDMEKLITIAVELAGKSGMKMSAKRTLCSTSRSEHIKIGITHGVILPNDQIQLYTAEKSNAYKSSVLERVSSFIDTYSVKATRLVDGFSLLPLLFMSWPSMIYINAGDVRVIPTIGLAFSHRGYGLVPSVPLIRGMSSVLISYGILPTSFAIWARIVEILNAPVPRESINADQVVRDVKCSSLWADAFKRVNNDKPPFVQKDLQQLTPENGFELMLREVSFVKAIKAVSSQRDFYALNRLLKLKVVPQLTADSIRADCISRCERTDEDYAPVGTRSPYMSGDLQMQKFHFYLGLSQDNPSMGDYSIRLQRIMNTDPSEGAPHVTGKMLLSAIKGKRHGEIQNILRISDFSDRFIRLHIEEIHDIAIRSALHSTDTGGTVYTNVACTIDFSENAIRHFLILGPEAVRHRSYISVWMSIKHVLYAIGNDCGKKLIIR